MHPRITSKPALPQIKPAMLRTFHAALNGWYRAQGRHDLPWRNASDPYPIWISEVMLQQTQVATVKARFYAPFLEKFPTIEALAAAPQQAVLKAWEGLGYYSRARNLHKAAQQVVTGDKWQVTSESAPGVIGHNRHATCHLPPVTLPHTVNDLLALPGIGRNTAHAILAFGHRQPVAILEANVKRVVARIFALATPSDAELWQGAEMLLDARLPFDYNQAMMDIGALICTPRAPKCPLCPANRMCLGKTNPESYPIKKIKKAIPVRQVLITVAEDREGRLQLSNRGEALLGGLWGFPQSDPSPTTGQPTAKQQGRPLGTVTHTYSHFKLIGTVEHVRVKHAPKNGDWFTYEEIAALPLSKVDHKVLELVSARHSAAKNASKANRGRRKR